MFHTDFYRRRGVLTRRNISKRLWIVFLLAIVVVMPTAALAQHPQELVGKRVLGPKLINGDLEFTTIALPKQEFRSARRPLLHWSEDGRHIFALSNKGLILKISYPQLEIVGSVVLPSKAGEGWLRCGGQLWIHSRHDNLLYRIQEEPLEISKTIDLEELTLNQGAGVILGHPSSPHLVVVSNSLMYFSAANLKLMGVYPDTALERLAPELLERRRNRREQTEAAEPPSPVDFYRAELAANGEALVTTGHRGIHLFRFRQPRLHYQHTFPSCKRAWVLANGNLLGAEIGNKLVVCRMDNWRKPLVQFLGKGPVHFDAETRLLYATDTNDTYSGNKLIQVNTSGQRLQDYELRLGDIDFLLPSPKDTAFLICADDYFVVARPTDALKLAEPRLLQGRADFLQAQQPKLKINTIAMGIEGPANETEFCWTSTRLFALASVGVLHVVSLQQDGPGESHRIELGGQAAHLGRCSEGVFVHMVNRQRLWLFDPETLQRKLDLPLPKNAELCATATSALLYVILDGKQILAVDMRSGEVARTTEYDDLCRQSGTSDLALSAPVLSPSGERLYCKSKNRGEILTLNDGVATWKAAFPHTGAPINALRQNCVVSSDGNLLAFPTSDMGTVPPLRPGQRGVYIFASENLSRPFLGLPTEQRGAVAFNQARREIYMIEGQDWVVFDQKGRRIHQEPLFTANDQHCYTFDVHPSGNWLALACQDQVLLGQLTSKSTAPAIAPQAPLPKLKVEQLAAQQGTFKKLDFGTNRLADGVGWASDGRAFFAAFPLPGHATTTVRIVRVAVPSMEVEAFHDIAGTAKQLAVSSAGVVVWMDNHVLWVLNSESLKVRHNVSLDNITSLATDPKLAMAWVVTGSRDLYCLDLHSGRQINHVPRERFQQILPDGVSGTLEVADLACDAAKLAVSIDRILHLVHIDGGTVRKTTPVGNIQYDFMFRPKFSPDGRMLTVSGTIYNQDRSKQKKGFWIIDVAGSSAKLLYYAPVQVSTLHMQPDGQLGYAGRGSGSDGESLQVWTLQGKRFGWQIPSSSNRVESLAVHPAGNAVLFHERNLLILADFGCNWSALPTHVPEEKELPDSEHVAAAPVRDNPFVVGVENSNGVKIVTLNIKASAHSAGSNLVWDTDKPAFLVLDKQQMLRRIAMPSLEEQANVRVANHTCRLQMSKEAVVIWDCAQREAQLYHPQSLKLLKQIKLPSLHEAACSANSHLLVGHDGTNLIGIDLQTGKMTFRQSREQLVEQAAKGFSRLNEIDPLRTFTAMNKLTMSPDGKCIIFLSDQILHQFRISERDGCHSYRRITSQPVFHYTHGLLSGHVVAGSSSSASKIEVLADGCNRRANLSLPYQTGFAPSGIYDDKRELIYLFGEQGQLRVLSQTGSEQLSLRPFGRGAGGRAFLVETPARGNVFVYGDDGLVWLDFTSK